MFSILVECIIGLIVGVGLGCLVVVFSGYFLS